MNPSQNPIIRLWKSWFMTRSTEPTVVYRERALRVLLPIITLLRMLGMLRYSNVPSLPQPYAPLWLSLAFFSVPIFVSFYFLTRQKVDWAGTFFVLHWYLADLLSLPAEGYWYAGFQISLIIQIVLATLLLPSRIILPFLIFQLTTVGMWGNWLDRNYYDPPLLSSGKPVAVFLTTIITLAAQEAIIMFTVRYLRLAMENSLLLQQNTIQQLQEEITERHHLQEEREEYIDELNKKNAELERFTYTVSHDLKSPIVTIKGFVGMLGKDIQENRPDLVQNDLRRIEGAADKMDALLKDLLELSRIGRVINPLEEVDLVKLTYDALEMLDGRIRSKNVRMIVSPNLPVIFCDRVRLREVMENLIDNAVKYTGDQPDPNIEVGVFNEKDEQVIFVKDNGMGIDPRYHDRIFRLFEKLNPTSEGTGVGLTLVKRIIEVHGGRVWVVSDGSGKGTTFCFTVPNRMKNITSD